MFESYSLRGVAKELRAFLALAICVSVLAIAMPAWSSPAGRLHEAATRDVSVLNMYTGRNEADWVTQVQVPTEGALAGLVGSASGPGTATAPVLGFSTVMGGSGKDEGWSIAVDKRGNTYVSGITHSPDLAGPGGYAGEKDVFAAKFSMDGDLIYVTVIGGSESEEGNAIAVDDYGNAYIAGQTFSLDFPIIDAWQPVFVGYEEAFLLKLGPNGELLYSTYIGGTRAEEVNDMVADAVGNVYLGGEVYSDDYPLKDPWSSATFGDDEEDGFITIFNAEGDLVYSTLVSAPMRDQVFRIAVDADGYVYGTGMTSSPDFPTVNAFQSTYGGDWDDCFVFKLDPWRNEMLYATLLGGSGRDECWGIAVDNEGAAYVTGHTLSDDFPITNAFQPERAGIDDVFVTKVSPEGSELLFSTFLGGSKRDRGWDLALDGGDNVYVVGETSSPDFPTVDALQPYYHGEMDAFVAVIDPENALVYASFLGGADYERGYRLVLDEDWVVHVTGGTASQDFPTTGVSGGGGATDAFVTTYGLIPTPTPTPTQTPMPTPTPYASAVIGRTGGAVWMSYPGHFTLLTVPAGLLDEPETFTLTYESRPQIQGDLTGIDHFFSIASSLPADGSKGPYKLPGELQLAAGFEEGPVIDGTLHVYRLAASGWSTDAVTSTLMTPGYAEVLLAWTGTYALLGESNRICLPIVLRRVR